jgi:phosphoglycerate kinase
VHLTNEEIMIKTLDSLELKGKRVLIRSDLNVPLGTDGSVSDDLRIRESLPTIEKSIREGARTIIVSHLGRPDGKRVEGLSMKPVAVELSRLLAQPVTLAPDCIGDEVESMVREMKDGDVILLENVRFHAGEKENDPKFAAALASLADVYVNDAFGTAHRSHASTVGITKFVTEKCGGYLLLKEVSILRDTLSNPERPFIAILGGSKVSGKIDVIDNLLDTCDEILIGGGMVFTFLRAQDIETGNSIVEEDRIDVAASILRRANDTGVEVLLPVDVVVADRPEKDAESTVVSIDAIPEGKMGLDIGPKTSELYTGRITNAKTVFWNGPMGVYELQQFSRGTRGVAIAMAKATENGARTVVGGGDSAAAVRSIGIENDVTHVSTGGGASLEFMEGKTLPGIAALESDPE